MAKYCGECSKVMPPSGRCECGWFDVTSTRWGRDCAYHDGHRKCPASGGMSFSIKGNSPWYCVEHYRHIHDKAKCIEIIDDYEKNGVPPERNWRDEMVDNFNRPALGCDDV